MARLIDADALLNTLKYFANRKHNRELKTSYSNAFKECMEFVKCAPTIALHHVEIKHGHWVQGKESSRCSECNCTLAGQALWMYCPNCGAMMDGERKKDENL